MTSLTIVGWPAAHRIPRRAAPLADLRAGRRALR